MPYMLFALAAFIGGIVQGTTGFGAGVISMLVLPYLLPLPEAAGVSGAIAIWICGMIFYRYRQHVNWSNIWVIVAVYLMASLTAIQMAPRLNTTSLKLAFGVFLIVLALYFLLVKDNLVITPNLMTKVIVGGLSGLSDGFFGIGGPLMVVLYLAFSKSREEYLATLQLSFVLVSAVNLVLRLQQGILDSSHLPFIVLGLLAMTGGLQIAHRLNERLNSNHLRQATYWLIACSGILTVVTTLWN
ncbi:sulfite exporter TauE/SafE family protein [Streptococcus entericus]|uniref:sulfite exporter TauE/SafE family protein n=1 Tax=Streptococcus entericus TaxID=155680 RepID=UPI00036B4E66|nr:sulfite exporter TauE/SafE family protein [Streptococcus entericus]